MKKLSYSTTREPKEQKLFLITSLGHSHNRVT